jgi:hypothetical protein
VSATSRAIATARARASVCFRDAERAAEYDVARADFLADSVDFVGISQPVAPLFAKLLRGLWRALWSWLLQHR